MTREQLWAGVRELRAKLDAQETITRTNREAASVRQDWKTAAYWDGAHNANQMALNLVQRLASRYIHEKAREEKAFND